MREAVSLPLNRSRRVSQSGYPRIYNPSNGSQSDGAFLDRSGRTALLGSWWANPFPGFEDVLGIALEAGDRLCFKRGLFRLDGFEMVDKVFVDVTRRVGPALIQVTEWCRRLFIACPAESRKWQACQQIARLADGRLQI